MLARIRVAWNRKQNTENEKKTDTVSYGELTLNLNEHSVFYGKEEINLTKKEYELLECMLENKGTALSRERILKDVWDYDYYGDTNVVDVYIRYLRQKIDDRFGITLIHTVRGVGYIIKDENK